MIEKVFKAIDTFALFEDTREITVALSGGADSVCLLHILSALKEKYGFDLYAAHFNHKIRGEEADRDEEFSRKFCEKLSVPFICGNADVISYSNEKGLSLETAARELRYKFLYENKKGKIATAHTASDNLETMIFNLVRGTSSDGMKGIPPVRDIIIRPLIFCTRDDIEKYCRDNSLQYVTDSTNFVDDCSRNIIRHKIVPILKSINNGAEQNASKLSLILGEDALLLGELANSEFEKRFSDKGLDIRGFSKLNKAVAKRVIIKYYKSVFGNKCDFNHIESIYDVCVKNGIKTSIPNGLYAYSEDNFLIFGKYENDSLSFDIELKTYSYENYINSKKINGLFTNSVIDYDKIVGKLKKVKKENSDTLKLVNSNSTKTVKKLLTEKKVPLSFRENLPVFSDDLGIVWAYKIGTADRVKVDKKTKNVLFFDTKIIKGKKK